jgi:hypothetical protein
MPRAGLRSRLARLEAVAPRPDPVAVWIAFDPEAPTSTVRIFADGGADLVVGRDGLDAAPLWPFFLMATRLGGGPWRYVPPIYDLEAAARGEDPHLVPFLDDAIAALPAALAAVAGKAMTLVVRSNPLFPIDDEAPAC